ncbi:MAG: hypothetical protein HBSAPP03_21870 [Phycisphaerae bacterium]|nr:MAG: hypothetical protein HBSAPP03_21870 [Phycisphaerae bacterium]
MRRSRGAIVLECMLALAIFVAGALMIVSAMNGSAGAIARAGLTARAADHARNVMSRIEAGLARPETLSGPMLGEDGEPLGPEAWELEVRTEPAGPAGLTRVMVRAVLRPEVGSDRELASFELVQAMRLTREASWGAR